MPVGEPSLMLSGFGAGRGGRNFAVDSGHVRGPEQGLSGIDEPRQARPHLSHALGDNPQAGPSAESTADRECFKIPHRSDCCFQDQQGEELRCVAEIHEGASEGILEKPTNTAPSWKRCRRLQWKSSRARWTLSRPNTLQAKQTDPNLIVDPSFVSRIEQSGSRRRTVQTTVIFASRNRDSRFYLVNLLR